MKVFLSWSGDLSCEAAKAFHNWLPFVINRTAPWMSHVDIDAGARWGNDVEEQLEKSRFGILFVTPSNVEAPWLLFEAGALAKSLSDSFVCPYLIGLKLAEVPTGPLTQFQAKPSDKAGTWELVKTINKALESESTAEDRLQESFEVWWPKLDQTLTTLPVSEEPPARQRSVDDMVDELLVITRGIDRKISGSSNPSIQDIVNWASNPPILLSPTGQQLALEALLSMSPSSMRNVGSTGPDDVSEALRILAERIPIRNKEPRESNLQDAEDSIEEDSEDTEGEQ